MFRILFLVMLLALRCSSLFGQGPTVCYSETDDSCAGRYQDPVDDSCNLVECDYTHELNPDGSQKVSGNHYVVIYECPENVLEYLRQDGVLKECNATSDPSVGDFTTVGNTVTIKCHKKRYCAAQCMVIVATYGHPEGTPFVYRARCQSDDGGPLLNIDGGDSSQPCAGGGGACPNEGE